MRKIDRSQHHIVSVLMWSIWKNRNNKVWNDTNETCQSICERASTLLASWTSVQNTKRVLTTEQNVQEVAHWTKPPPGRYKCNVDATFFESMDMVGVGICIRDEHMAFVLARMECFTPMLEVDTGDALGLLTAMQWVKDLQLYNMDFEVDSKMVVDSIYGKQLGVSNFSVTIKDCIHLLCTDLVNSDVKFIRRQANEVAHSLAREAPSIASFHILYYIPSCIEPIIINEMH